MALAQLTASYRQARTDRAANAARRPPRTPLAVHIGRGLARITPRLAALRTAVLSVAGFGCIDYAAWLWIHAAGYAAIGVSILAVEYLITSDSRRGGGA